MVHACHPCALSVSFFSFSLFFARTLLDPFLRVSFLLFSCRHSSLHRNSTHRHCTTRTVNRGIINNNFAAALGLPKEGHHGEPRATHGLWKLRRGQLLFLRENALSAAMAVRQWDKEHQFGRFPSLLRASPFALLFHVLPSPPFSQGSGGETRPAGFCVVANEL